MNFDTTASLSWGQILIIYHWMLCHLFRNTKHCVINEIKLHMYADTSPVTNNTVNLWAVASDSYKCRAHM